MFAKIWIICEGVNKITSTLRWKYVIRRDKPVKVILLTVQTWFRCLYCMEENPFHSEKGHQRINFCITFNTRWDMLNTRQIIQNPELFHIDWWSSHIERLSLFNMSIVVVGIITKCIILYEVCLISSENSYIQYLMVAAVVKCSTVSVSYLPLHSFVVLFCTKSLIWNNCRCLFTM